MESISFSAISILHQSNIKAIVLRALENMPDTWIAQQYLEKWDGKLPQLITGDGSGVMLTPNLGD